MDKIKTFATIVSQATRGDLVFPTSVNAALKLQMALNDPDCHVEDAIKQVLAEPLLATRVVALANSVGFNRRGGAAITNVRAAVQRVGYRNLASLASAMVVRSFGNRINDPVLRAKAEQLWQHSAHTAALAYVLARKYTKVDADTALFSGIVHEVGSFYLLARADEFPGLLDEPESWMAAAEEIITREVLKKLLIPETVSMAIESLRNSALTVPPVTLLDTLILAKQLAPVESPMARFDDGLGDRSDAVREFLSDNEALDQILEESAEEASSMSSALLV